MSGYLWSCPYLYALDGTLIRETTERPLELGRVVEKSYWHFEIEFEDAVYRLPRGHWRPLKFQRLAGNVLLRLDPKEVAVWRVDKTLDPLPDGRALYQLRDAERWELPKNEVDCKEVPLPDPIGWQCSRENLRMYQGYVVDAAGNIYVGVRTAPHYEILKWTWQD